MDAVGVGKMEFWMVLAYSILARILWFFCSMMPLDFSSSLVR